MKKTTSNPKSGDSCDINFSKVKDRSVKVYVGDNKHEGVEIIGSKGKYAVHTDSKNEKLSSLRGKSGTLQEVKRAVSGHLCGMQSSSSNPAPQKEMTAADPSPIKKKENV